MSYENVKTNKGLGFFQELQWKFKMKKRKGYTLIELVIVGIILMILAAVGMKSMGTSTNGSKVAVAHTETKMLADASALYAATAVDSNPPTDLGALVTGIAAANAVDRQDHGAFVTKTGWTSAASSITDPWGNPYVYDSAARTVSCTNNGGTAWVDSF